jgi:hypothetical protein
MYGDQIRQLLTEFLRVASLRLKLKQLLLLARVEDLRRYFIDFPLELLQPRLSTFPNVSASAFWAVARHDGYLSVN